MSDLKHLIYERRGPAAWLSMNRPEKRNALNSALVGELIGAFERAAGDEEVRVVVLTGEGSAFSAGADLADLQALQQASAEDNLADSTLLAGLFRQIYHHRCPVIARINGHALAGGCGLAAVCDFSIASSEAMLGFPEVRIGFVPAIVSVFVLQKLGEAAARDLLLTGRLITAGDAARAGLVTRSVPADVLDEAVNALVTEISAETSGTAVRLTKQLAASVQGMGLAEALAHAVQVNALARATDDCKAGVEAFLSKQDSPWKKAARNEDGA